MIYLSLFCLMMFAAFISMNSKNKRTDSIVYYVLFIVMTFMLCFRYGQGTDYFNYQYLFESFSSWRNVMNSNEHGEFGFRLLCYVFKGSYEQFILVVSFGEMMLLDRFIRLNSENKCMSLFLFYPTFYLIYFFSGIRQGLALALFIGIAYGFFKKKKLIIYIVCVLAIASIHSVALMYLLIPIVQKMKAKHFLVLIPICFMFGLFSIFVPFVQLFAKIPYIGAIIFENTKTSFSVLATAERLIMLGAMVILYYNKQGSCSEEIDDCFKYYLVGYCAYFFLLPFATLATRLMICFKVFELILIPYLLSRRNNAKQIFALFLLMISTVSYFHNINASISQGSYYSSNALNYPYVSVFNKEDISDYRSMLGEFTD